MIIKGLLIWCDDSFHQSNKSFYYF